MKIRLFKRLCKIGEKIIVTSFTFFPVKSINPEKYYVIIPPADLNGSFGDDLMIYSAINQIQKDSQIIVYTRDGKRRDDYLSDFGNIVYKENLSQKSFLRNYKLLKHCKHLIILGADIMDGTYSKDETDSRYEILELAISMKVSCTITGSSLSNQIQKNIESKLVSISEHTTLCLREQKSFDRAQNIGCKNLVLTSDIAFLSPNPKFIKEPKNFSSFSNWIKERKEKQQLIIAVCPNSIQADRIGLNLYLNNFNFLLNCFSKKNNCAFVFLYHDIRKLCGELSDNDLSKMLYKKNKETTDSFFNDSIRNGIELKHYISMCDITITARMHFGISGLTLGIPMFGIGYQNKFEGLMNLFNVDPKITLINYFDIGKFNDVMASNFIEYAHEYRSKIEQNIAQIKVKSLNNFESIN